MYQLRATGLPDTIWYKEHSTNILLYHSRCTIYGRTEIGHNFWKPVTKRTPYMLWNLTVYGFIGRTEIGHIFWKPVTKRTPYMQWDVTIKKLVKLHYIKYFTNNKLSILHHIRLLLLHQCLQNRSFELLHSICLLNLVPYYK